ncbi:MAG TPA: hypothetical protein VGP80_06565 [Gemmatimonadales bacterium]|jgi:hypothetical protein|nr:hypothetical protein [Gemmatimonadales bacterium]
MSKSLLVLGLALAAACGGGGPSKVPPISLGAPIDSLELPYSYLDQAVWLGANQWAVVAPNEHAAVLLDFSQHSTAALGDARHPEYTQPFAIFKGGDSLYLDDWGKRSVTVWNPGYAGALDISQFIRGAFPEARDRAGRFYLKLPPIAGPDGSGNRDSAAIVAISSGRADTVGRLAPPDIAEVFGDAGRRFEPRALSGNDEWGVLPDGTLWIARINQNRVDRRSPEGKWNRGEQLPDRVLEVLPEDRDLFLQQFPPDLRSTAEKVPFAIIKPPFVSAYADPDGNVWLMKNYSLLDSTRSVQRVGADGRLVAQYEYPGYGRVIGGNREVLLVAESKDKATSHRIVVYRIPEAVKE